MKPQLVAIVAAVLVVGCATTQSPEPPTTKVQVRGSDREGELDVPILAAAYNGNIEAVKQHLAAGTDVNVKGGFADGTPLHYAAANGHKEIAELLIEKGADMNAKDEDGGTPLDVAIKYKQTETVDLLRKHGGISGAADSIHLAAAVGNIEAVKQHLAAGVDVTAKGYRGFTPLHYAARNGHKEIAELLITKGADVNAKDEDGNTPLDKAIKRNHTETADLLRKHGTKTAEELKAEGN
jgi:cytohesin